MANGQIPIHQRHLPHHFFVSVPVDLAGSSYEKATEMAYIVLTKSRKGYWRPKDLYRNDLTGEIHCQCSSLRRRVRSSLGRPLDRACAVAQPDAGQDAPRGLRTEAMIWLQ
jgi:hypothetical protein